MQPLTDNDRILKRASKEISQDMLINLGIGLPQLIVNHISPEDKPIIHSENGIIGMGTTVAFDEANPYCIDAGGSYVDIEDGGVFVDSAESFSIVRRGKIDASFLGAFQVSTQGDLANWHIPGGKKMGMGGALEIASCAKKLIILMKHQDKKGNPKIVDQCSFPLTAKQCVNLVITEKAVFEISSQAMTLIEIASGLNCDDIIQSTTAKFSIAEDLKEF